MSEQPRYAIYFSPDPEGELWRFGSKLIGYDAFTGDALDFDYPEDVDNDDWRQLTADPRRYGFHATLKAPFRILDGMGEDDLMAQFAKLSGNARAVSIGPMNVRTIGSFVAIVPKVNSKDIVQFAADVVRQFEPLRAPLTDTEMARRLESPLTESQKRLLTEFGYPYVLDEFRFHMTLTGPIHHETRIHICSVLQQRYDEKIGSLEIFLDRISIYKQSAANERFRIIASTKLR